MKTATIALCALAITAACLPSDAHDHATGVVKERMEMMEVMAKRMKAIRERIEGKRDPAAIKAALARQAASPVRWVEVIQHMSSAGVTDIAECGPGKVLAGFTRRIDAALTSHTIAEPDSLSAALEALK